MIRLAFFDRNRLRAVLEPRKPRHRLMRAALGLVGLAVLSVLVFFGLFVGAAMVAAGLGWRLLRARQQRPAAPARVVEGEYRVVRKPALPLSPH
ncbi:MAG: hypothetical protein QM601_08290 [Pseudoxanthomonas sp.]